MDPRGDAAPATNLKRLAELTGADPDWIKKGKGLAPWEVSTLDHIRARVDQIADHLGLPAIPGGEVGRAELEKAGESLLRDPSPARKARPGQRSRRAS